MNPPPAAHTNPAVQAFYANAVSVLQQWQYTDEHSKKYLKPEMRRIIDSPLLAQAATIKDGGGDTLLHTALTCKAFDLAHAIADRKVSLEIANDYGLTPLLHAVHLGHLQAAGYLIEKGADASHATPDGMNALHLLARLRMPPHDMNAYALQHMDMRPSLARTKTAAVFAKHALTGPLATQLILHGADPLARASYMPLLPSGTPPDARERQRRYSTPSEIALDANNKALAKQLMPGTDDYLHHEWIESFRQACRENRVEADGEKPSVPQLLKQGFERHWVSMALLKEAGAIANRGNRLEDGKTTDGHNPHGYYRLAEIIKHAQGMLVKQHSEEQER